MPGLFPYLFLRKRRKRGTLSKEREKLLNDIGFVWDIKQYNWDLNFHRLLQYKKKYGHACVCIHSCDIPGLGSWVSWIRRNIHNLSKERIKQLKSVGFEWETEKSKKKRKQFIAEKIRNDGYLTLTETKKLFGVKRATIYRMRKKGWLKFYKIDRNILFKKEDIIEAMNKPELVNYRNRLSKVKKVK